MSFLPSGTIVIFKFIVCDLSQELQACSMLPDAQGSGVYVKEFNA